MIKTTKLYEEHSILGATFINFGGWKMPLHYGSQLQEHQTVRTQVGVFDISHMTSIDVEGKEAQFFLRKILANDLKKLKSAGKALYSCMLDVDGGIIDDLIVYWINENRYRLVVNAATTEKDIAWLQQQAEPFAVNILPRYDLAMLAVQGPKAWTKAEKIFNQKQNKVIRDLKPFSCVEVNDWLIACTGYTGEEGFEIMLPQEEIFTFWRHLLANDIKPIGLGARDSLRLEAGFNLYGVDMDESVSPLESNLAWTIDWKDPNRDFIGKEALQKKQQIGIKQQLVGLVLLGDGICRAGMSVFVQERSTSSLCGKLTSGGFSPTLSRSVGLARIEKGDFSVIEVDIRGKKIPAKIVKLPFVRQGKPNFSL